MVNDGRDKNLPAHHVDKGDPRVNGPFLDDVREDQLRAYREVKKKVDSGPSLEEKLLKKKKERAELLKKAAQENIDKREAAERSALEYLRSRKDSSVAPAKKAAPVKKAVAKKTVAKKTAQKGKK